MTLRTALTIVRMEWRLAQRDSTWRAVTALLVLLLAFGIYTGKSRAVRNNADLRERALMDAKLVTGLREEAQRYEEAVRRDPSVQPPPSLRFLTLGTTGIIAQLPPRPLFGLSAGQADTWPSATRVSMQRHWTDLFAESEPRNPQNVLSGTFDLAFVLVYVFPLFILAMSYDLVSSERESGTLAITLSMPVSLRHIVLAKIAVRALVLEGLAALAVVVAVSVNGAAPDSLSVALWILTLVLYGLCWFAIAAGGSALGYSSQANAVMLTAVWLTFVLVIPSAIGYAISFANPVPSRSEIIQKTRRLTVRGEQDEEQILAQAALQPANPVRYTSAARTYYLVHRYVENGIEPEGDRFERQLALQREWVARCQFLSPAIAAQESFDELAGTGSVRYARFRAQSAWFQKRWQQFFAGKIFDDSLLTVADYDRAPRFVWNEEDRGTVARRIAVRLGVLALFATLPMLFAMARLRH